MAEYQPLRVPELDAKIEAGVGIDDILGEPPRLILVGTGTGDDESGRYLEIRIEEITPILSHAKYPAVPHPERFGLKNSKARPVRESVRFRTFQSACNGDVLVRIRRLDRG
jgi:hypothetical protein